MPISGKPTSTTMMPPKKATEPLILCFWKKKRNVRSKPMTHARPARKRICRESHRLDLVTKKCLIKMSPPLTLPMASSPLSKSIRMPRMRNATPNPARPTPISKRIDKIGSHLIHPAGCHFLTLARYILCVSVMSIILLVIWISYTALFKL